MIDADYNYDRLVEKIDWLGIDPKSVRHILITHQDTGHISAAEADSTEETAYFIRSCGIHRIDFFYDSTLKMNDVGTALTDKLRGVRNDIYGLSAFTQRFHKSGHIQHMPIIKSSCRFVQKYHGTLGGNSRGYGKPLFLPARQRGGVSIREYLKVKPFKKSRLLLFHPYLLY